MIYLFENPDNTASIIYDETTLTEDLKQKGIAIEVLPIREDNGKDAILKCKKSTNEVWYEYIDVPVDTTQERLALCEQALLDLMMGV